MGAGKECLLTLTGVHHPPQNEGEPMVTVQQVRAEYFQRGESRYLIYEERPEGYPVPLKTRVKRKGNSVEIYRKSSDGGRMESRMVFEKDLPYRTEYATPMGTLPLDIATAAVEVEKSPEDWPDVRIVYELTNQGESLGRYELDIRVEPDVDGGDGDGRWTC